MPGVFRRAHGAQLSTEPGAKAGCGARPMSFSRFLSRRHSHSHIPFIRFTLPCYTANCVTVSVLYGPSRIAGPFPALCFPSPPPWMRRQPYPDAIVLLHCIPYVMDGAAMTDKALAPRWLPRTSRGGCHFSCTLYTPPLPREHLVLNGGHARLDWTPPHPPPEVCSARLVA